MGFPLRHRLPFRAGKEVLGHCLCEHCRNLTSLTTLEALHATDVAHLKETEEKIT